MINKALKAPKIVSKNPIVTKCKLSLTVKEYRAILVTSKESKAKRNAQR